MKGVFVAVGILVVALLIWVAWKLQPWMPAGRTIKVGAWTYGTNEFQVWQSKNELRSEPFSTGLFVRSGTNRQWRASTLGIQDCYMPRVGFRELGERIQVVVSGKQVGNFWLSNGIYLQNGRKSPVVEGVTDDPAKWWHEPIAPK